MYKSSFGSSGQIQFANEHEYYKFLGFLAKSDGSTGLTWEHNEEQGAWASEGRIHILKPLPLPYPFNVSLTAGVGNIVARINCNEFVENIRDNHNFIMGTLQNISSIRSTVPQPYLQDFDYGLTL